MQEANSLSIRQPEYQKYMSSGLAGPVNLLKEREQQKLKKEQEEHQMQAEKTFREQQKRER
jgi:hypothetical protein